MRTKTARKLHSGRIVIIVIIALILSVPIVLYLTRTRKLPPSISDRSYCESSNSKQTFDLYQPKVASGNVPFVVYIHGGGWRGGDKSNALTRAYVPFFLQRGIAVVSIDYRLSPESVYPAQNEDVACALTYLDDNAMTLHLDSSKSLFFGDSAGGELAAFAALAIPYKSYDYKAPKGVIDFYGVSDFSSIVNSAHPDKNARFYLGSKYNSLADTASPSHYVSAKAPRFLFVHGTKDRVVPLSQTISINSALQTDGIDTELLVLQGVGHGFAGPELSKATYQKIQQSIDTFLKETIL